MRLSEKVVRSRDEQSHRIKDCCDEDTGYSNVCTNLQDLVHCRFGLSRSGLGPQAPLSNTHRRQ